MMFTLLTSLFASVELLSSMPLGYRFINFAIFAIALGAVLYKPLTQGLQARANSIEEELQRAGKEIAAAEAKMKELDTRISRLDDEISDIKKQSERDAKAERERIAQTTKEDAERLRAMARLEIEGAMKAARTELRAFAASQAVEMAEAIIRRELKDADRDQLVNRYVDRMERVN